MRRVRERGSICLYVAVCLVSIGLLTAAVVPLATAMGARATRRSDELRARLAFEAAVALVKSQGVTMSTTLGAPTALTLNGVTVSATPTANDAQLAKSVLVAGTATRNGRTYRYRRVIGCRIPSPFCFALLSDGQFDMNAPLVTGANGVDGDVYAGDKFIVNASGDTINGNIVAQKTISTKPDTSVTGLLLPNYANIAWSPVASPDYQGEASSLVASGLGNVLPAASTLPALTFVAPQSGTYPIVYCGQDLNLSGTISGRGTLYVNGNLKITGDLTYANPASVAAIIVRGTITVVSGVSTVNGVLYSNSGFASQSDSLTIPRGMIVTKTVTSDKPLTIVRDNVARNDSDEATRLRLPYYWP